METRPDIKQSNIFSKDIVLFTPCKAQSKLAQNNFYKFYQYSVL